MNNKDKNEILEMLSEVLQKVDESGEKIDRNAQKIDGNTQKIDTLTGVIVRQNTILRGMADDIQELKGVKVDVKELERRVDELERYTGKK